MRENGHSGDDSKPSRPSSAPDLLQRRLEYAWEEIKHLSDELSLARASTSGQKEESEESLLSLKAKFATLLQALDEKEQHLGKTTAQCADLAHQIEILHQDLHEKDQLLGNTKKERSSIVAELLALQHDRHEKDRLLDQTVAQCQQVRGELEDRNAAFDDLQEELSSARHLVTNLQKVRRNRPRSNGFTRSSGHGLVFGSLFLRGLMVGVALTTAVAGILWPRSDRLQLAANQITSEIVVGQSPLNTDEKLAAMEPLAHDREHNSTAAPIRQVRDVLRDGSRGPRMIVVESGNFAMGNGGSRVLGDEWPVHDVKVREFLFGAHEVTFDEYDRFARATGSRMPDDFGYGRGRRPVVDVSWSDAQAYAKWLYRQTRRRYRLPSEAEWEYAARGGSTTAYWWGYEPGRGQAVCFDCGTRWDNRLTLPVGSFRANSFGLYDTAGNAMEWVADCYHPDYRDAPNDGSPWADGDCSTRIARGGAFNKPSRSMRSMARHHFAPGTRVNMLGFRLASDS